MRLAFRGVYINQMSVDIWDLELNVKLLMNCAAESDVFQRLMLLPY